MNIKIEIYLHIKKDLFGNFSEKLTRYIRKSFPDFMLIQGVPPVTATIISDTYSKEDYELSRLQP